MVRGRRAELCPGQCPGCPLPLLVLGPSSHLPTDSTLSPIPNKHPQMSTPDGCSDRREPQVTRSGLPFHILGFRVHYVGFRRQPLLNLPHNQQPATLDAPGPPSFSVYYFHCIRHFPKCYSIYSFITPFPISSFGVRNAHPGCTGAAYTKDSKCVIECILKFIGWLCLA